MEYQEGLRLLRNRMDESLKHHAETTDMTDIGEIYRLQEYSETHYCMKATHDYDKAEVEALLAFEDPLEVAFWCREENTHAVGLPICEILKEIHADERFAKRLPELSSEEKMQTLIIRLGKNLYDFQEKLQIWSNRQLIDHCEEIAATMAAYKYMTEDFAANPPDHIADYLLQYENPLKVLCEHWPECTLFGSDVLADIQDQIKDLHIKHEQPESVHKRLKTAARAVQEQSKSNKPQRSDGAR